MKTVLIALLILTALPIAASAQFYGQEESSGLRLIFERDWRLAALQVLEEDDCGDESCPARKLAQELRSIDICPVLLERGVHATFASPTLLYANTWVEWTKAYAIVVLIHELLHKAKKPNGEPICGADRKPREKICHLWGRWANSSPDITRSVEDHFRKRLKRWNNERLLTTIVKRRWRLRRAAELPVLMVHMPLSMEQR